jgi:hypothetical protein
MGSRRITGARPESLTERGRPGRWSGGVPPPPRARVEHAAVRQLQLQILTNERSDMLRHMERNASIVVFDHSYRSGSNGYGPFYRLQCPHVNELMCASGRIGGGQTWGTGFRRVHAYRGHLSDDLGGIEFWTTVEPYRHAPPALAYWNEGAPGVELLTLSDRELAAIPVTIVKRVDSYAYCRSCQA